MNNDLKAMSGKDDERKQGEWQSRYANTNARKWQIVEAIYIFLVVVVSITCLVLNTNGVIPNLLGFPEEKQVSITRIITCVLCGMLGGAIFDMKWFYKAVAHGFWNADRIYWRLFTPVISLSFAFCLACILKDYIVSFGDSFSAGVIGFLSGYFSDEAAGKMAEVAKVLFNASDKPKEEKSESQKSSGE